MKKLLLIFALFLFAVPVLNLMFSIQVSAQAPGVLIQPDEIARVLEDVKKKPTTAKTFETRLRVLEAWVILSAKSGKVEEIRQAVSPEAITNILKLKKDGQENLVFKAIDKLFLKMEKVGLPVVPVSTTSSQIHGKCGDGICDEFERAHPNLCPQDCTPEKLTEPSSNQKSTKEQKVSPTTANVIIDYSKELGLFSSYLFGNNSTGPQAAALGFKFTLSGGAPPMANPKDANDLSNYRFFAEMDKVIEDTFNAGLEPMIMFSVPAPQQESDSEDFFSQKYFEQFSLYVKKVATHLRDAKWPNNGKIHAARFGNEPDLKIFFKGTQMDYFRSYETFAKALKSVNPYFIIDAPGFAVRQIDDKKSWIKDFLSYIDKKAYLDIFDVHVYSPSPNDFYNQFKSLKEELVKYPKLSNIYGVPAMASNEWNFLLEQSWSGKYHSQFDTSWHSSFTIASLINMIEQGVILSVPINLITPNSQDYGLVHEDGRGKPTYYAFKGFNQLAATKRLFTSGTDHMNFAAISGKNNNGVIVILSNYNISMYMDKYLKEERQTPGTGGTPFAWSDYNAYVAKYGEPKVYNKYTLTLNNLPWNYLNKVTYERYVVDDNKKLELIEAKTMPGASTLTFTKDISAPSVEVVKVYMLNKGDN